MSGGRCYSQASKVLSDKDVAVAFVRADFLLAGLHDVFGELFCLTSDEGDFFGEAKINGQEVLCGSSRSDRGTALII